MDRFYTYLLAFLLVLSFCLKSTTAPALAVDTPSFSSCVNPTGEVKVSYSSGTHGIAGNTGSFSGSDAVYTISANSLMQCFCPDDGNGIQTNWFKANNLTEAEIDSLKADGWIFIPNGALWGLDQAPYLAKNSSYSCKGSSSGGSSGGSGGQGGSGGSVQGISASLGSVLGLASTGNNAFVYGLALGGIILLASGLFLKFKSSK